MKKQNSRKTLINSLTNIFTGWVAKGKVIKDVQPRTFLAEVTTVVCLEINSKNS